LYNYWRKRKYFILIYGEEISVSIDGNVKTYQFSNPKHVQQPMIERTVDYFLGNNTNPCSVEEAAIVTKIMDVFCGKK
jgi:hypothetical protein